MNRDSGTSPQTARAAERQPSNFAGLRTEVIAVDDLAVTRAIACECGGRTGRVLAGELLPGWGWLDPLTWLCGACARAHDFFDSGRDGYDGRLGIPTQSQQATSRAEIGCPRCGAREFAIQCQLIYNIEAAELDEILGPDKAHLLSDYFDWLEVSATCAACHHRFSVGDWELA